MRGPSARSRPEAPAAAQVYWTKAQRFARAACSNAEEGHWDPAVANAINAVINCVDALCVHHLGRRSSSGTHRDALLLLDSCTDLDARIRRALGSHLRNLLQQKTLAQYDARLMEASDAAAALSHLERALEASHRAPAVQEWTQRGPGP